MTLLDNEISSDKQVHTPCNSAWMKSQIKSFPSTFKYNKQMDFGENSLLSRQG